MNNLIEQEYENLTTDSKKLATRLSLNKKTQKFDFSEWLFNIFPKINKNFNILDLGCGTGKQTSFFLDKVDSSGSVCAIDASIESINSIPNDERLRKFAIDFNNIDELGKVLNINNYQIINSTYAIYYANNPLQLIKTMKERFLADQGKMIISGPTWPHDLYTLVIKEFGENSEITKTINFMENALTPFLKTLLGSYELHFLNNSTVFKSADEAVTFVKNTTYGSHINIGDLELFINSLKNLEFRKTNVTAIFS